MKQRVGVSAVITVVQCWSWCSYTTTSSSSSSSSSYSLPLTCSYRTTLFVSLCLLAVYQKQTGTHPSSCCQSNHRQGHTHLPILDKSSMSDISLKTFFPFYLKKNDIISYCKLFQLQFKCELKYRLYSKQLEIENVPLWVSFFFLFSFFRCLSMSRELHLG